MFTSLELNGIEWIFEKKKIWFSCPSGEKYIFSLFRFEDHIVYYTIQVIISIYNFHWQSISIANNFFFQLFFFFFALLSSFRWFHIGSIFLQKKFIFLLLWLLHSYNPSFDIYDFFPRFNQSTKIKERTFIERNKSEMTVGNLISVTVSSKSFNFYFLNECDSVTSSIYVNESGDLFFIR